MAAAKLATPELDYSRESSSEPFQEHLYKVLVIGDFGVGKTSIIRRYTEDSFSPNYKLTIGVDFSLKTLEWKEAKINLQLWDIAGHERFGSMTRVYYKYAIAAIIVFDLTRQVTFDSVLKWLNDVHQKVGLESGESVPILVLANKCDIDSSQVDTDQLDDFCKKHNIAGWYPTSAKEGTNIKEAMEFLVKEIMELSKKELDSGLDMIDIGGDQTYTQDTNESLVLINGNGYSKVSKLNGMASAKKAKGNPVQDRQGSNSCCV